MDKSDNIANLTEALTKVQSTVENNQASCLETADMWKYYRQILTLNGLAVIQTAEVKESEITIETNLLHISNEFISTKFIVNYRVAERTSILGFDEISIFRFYALISILGLASNFTNSTDTSTKQNPVKLAPVESAPKIDSDEIKNPRELKAEEIFAAGAVVKKKENSYEVTETTSDGGLDVCTVTTSATAAVKCNCDDFHPITKNNKDFKCEHILAARLYYKANEMTATS